MDLTRREQIVSSLDDKVYRDAFVADQIRIGVPLQIKQMREELGLSQEQIGQQMNPPMVQESVWRLENPNKANLTISTLLRVAAAFDVALMVRFVPFSELIDSTPWLSGRDRAVPQFSKDLGLAVAPALATNQVVVGAPMACSMDAMADMSNFQFATKYTYTVAVSTFVPHQFRIGTTTAVLPQKKVA